MFITEHYIETSNNTNKNIYEDLISWGDNTTD